MEYVYDNDNSIRIDKYLIEKLNISRSKLQEMIKQNLVLVNDRKIKNSYLLKTNDKINIKGELNRNIDIKPVRMNLDIIYEDEDLMVINKPSGLVVHPGSGNYDNTLVNGLMDYTNNLSNNNGFDRPGIVHRIDKDTSGLLVIAKNDYAHEFLSKQLKDKTLSRVYIALVHGKINHDTGTIDAPIGRSLDDRKKMCVTSINSKEAVTHFRVIERYKNTTLIKCKLETGRTHQIRVHMAYINHPIVNDIVYSNKKCISDFGQMLHACEITFIHPRTKEKMTFKCDVPDEFNKILEKYKNE